MIISVVPLKGLKTLQNTSNLTHDLKANSELLLKTLNDIFWQITKIWNLLSGP